jgi:biotin carboxyl carrier protein
MTLDPRCVQSILAAAEASGWEEIAIGVGGSAALRISRAAPGSSTAQPVLPDAQSVVSSPSIGVFQPPVAGSAASAAGTVIPAGGVVGNVVVSTLVLPVQSDTGGVVVAVHAAAGDAVEYGTPLVTLETSRG